MTTIPMPEIAAAVSGIAGCTRQETEKFILELEAEITDRLWEEGSVEIEGLGTFRRMNVAGEISVEFAPDPELAEAVNAPFAIFDPIELDDEITGEMLEEAASAEPEPEAQPQPQPAPPQPAEEPAPAAAPQRNPQPENKPRNNPQPASKNEDATPTPPPAKEATREPAAPVTHERIIEKEKEVKVVEKGRHWPGYVATALVALAAGVAIGYFTADKLNLNGVKSVNISAEDVQIYHNPPTSAAETAIPAPQSEESAEAHPAEISADTATEVAKAPEAPQAPAEVVTDIVTSSRFLTTMAQEHYGKKKFWVYIYKENEDHLSNPDKIAPATVVVIPPAEKYGIKPGDKESEASAERLAAEILGKYSH